MSVAAHISKNFYEYLINFINDYQKETNQTLSISQATEIIFCKLKGKPLNVEVTIKGLTHKSVKTAVKSFWG